MDSTDLSIVTVVERMATIIGTLT
ncbi:MAG: hypothetical protein MUO88_03790 [Desulfobacterales bacterium]|nr:hypothetical protein [Desulfobacterales bacterium]